MGVKLDSNRAGLIKRSVLYGSAGAPVAAMLVACLRWMRSKAARTGDAAGSQLFC